MRFDLAGQAYANENVTGQTAAAIKTTTVPVALYVITSSVVSQSFVLIESSSFASSSLSSSYALTASYAMNVVVGNSTSASWASSSYSSDVSGTSSFAGKATFAYNAAILRGTGLIVGTPNDPNVDGNLSVGGKITVAGAIAPDVGSTYNIGKGGQSFLNAYLDNVIGTASYSNQSLSSSYAPFTQTFQASSSWASSSINALTASYVNRYVMSSSYLIGAAKIPGLENTPNVGGNLNVEGTVTVGGNITPTPASSFNIGKAGSSFANGYIDNVIGTASYSNQSLSSSYAPSTQTWQANVASSSYASSSLSASYAVTAQTVLGSITSASFATQALSASWAPGSSGPSTYASQSQWSVSSSFASSSVSASYAPFTQTWQASVASASYASSSTTAGTATSLGLTAYNISVLYASSSKQSVTSSYASSSLSASYAPFTQTWQANVASASYASSSLSASYALNAQTLLGSVTSASYALTASYASSATAAIPAGLVAETLTLNSANTVTFVTPGSAASVQTKINIPVYDPPAFGQLIIAGLAATAPVSARCFMFCDARTGAHQPTLGVFNPAEGDILGLSWEGSNTVGYVKSLAGDIGFLINTTELLRITPTIINAAIPISASIDGPNTPFAWASWYQIGNTVTIKSAYNLTVTRPVLGSYACRFVTPPATANYGVMLTGVTGSNIVGVPTASMGMYSRQTTTGFTASYQVSGINVPMDVVSGSITVFALQ